MNEQDRVLLSVSVSVSLGSWFFITGNITDNDAVILVNSHGSLSDTTPNLRLN